MKRLALFLCLAALLLSCVACDPAPTPTGESTTDAAVTEAPLTEAETEALTEAETETETDIETELPEPITVRSAPSDTYPLSFWYELTFDGPIAPGQKGMIELHFRNVSDETLIMTGPTSGYEIPLVTIYSLDENGVERTLRELKRNSIDAGAVHIALPPGATDADAHQWYDHYAYEFTIPTDAPEADYHIRITAAWDESLSAVFENAFTIGETKSETEAETVVLRSTEARGYPIAFSYELRLEMPLQAKASAVLILDSVNRSEQTIHHEMLLLKQVVPVIHIYHYDENGEKQIDRYLKWGGGDPDGYIGVHMEPGLPWSEDWGAQQYDFRLPDEILDTTYYMDVIAYWCEEPYTATFEDVFTLSE